MDTFRKLVHYLANIITQVQKWAGRTLPAEDYGWKKINEPSLPKTTAGRRLMERTRVGRWNPPCRKLRLEEDY